MIGNMIFLASSIGGSGFDIIHQVDTQKGLQLLSTAWDILGNTKFDLGFGTIDMKMVFFAVILFDLLGVLVYKIWGD